MDTHQSYFQYNKIFYENSAIKIRIAQDQENILFSVEDKSQGIAPQNIPKIFDRYFRNPGSKREGTGLSINKKFIDTFYGNISVNSALVSGSTFFVSLSPAYKNEVSL